MISNELIQTIATHALPVLLAITMHEAAHGYIAKLFGDNTAWSMGRVTLNPIPHIDLVGTIAMPLLLYVATSGQFLFGYAKPVPVDFSRLRHPKRDMIWVALAGPARAGILVNLVMFAFNLFPLPPLDGGRMVVGLLPWRMAVRFANLERYGFFIVMGLVLLGVVNALWMRPIMSASMQAIQWLLLPLAALFLPSTS